MGIQTLFTILGALAQLSSGPASPPAPQVLIAIPAQEVRGYCLATSNLANQVVVAKNAGWTVDAIVSQISSSATLSPAEHATLTVTVKYIYRDFGDPQTAARTVQSDCIALFRRYQIQYPPG